MKKAEMIKRLEELLVLLEMSPEEVSEKYDVDRDMVYAYMAGCAESEIRRILGLPYR